ncbi:MAG: hypothetical protein E4H28_08560 [Gemmatimonadales bacterium]|nr:MAG: hypothetical protein E4H28_08560 [Gemmatimonadales bacterium]
MVRQLLEVGCALTKDLAQWHSQHAAGPIRFTLKSSNVQAAKALTQYLFPASQSEFTLHLYIGPAPAWNLAHTHAQHLERLHVSEDGSLTAQYDIDSRIWMIWDNTTKRGLLWCDSIDSLPSWHRAAPFRNLLHWAFASTQYAIVHAGTVGGLLLAGKGGSGKSTTVAACALAGLPTCGDDMVIVGAAHAFRLYNAIKLDAPRASQWGLDAGDVVSGKMVYRYTDWSRSAPSTTAIYAIVLPVVANAPSSLVVKSSPAAALRALAPSTVFLLRGHEAKTLAKVAELVRNTPVYELRLGHDIKGVVECVQNLEEQTCLPSL